jgi:Uma2 family endonuclease
MLAVQIPDFSRKSGISPKTNQTHQGETAMMQTESKLMTLDEFLDWYPDGYGRFELHDGVVVEMQPTGTHERVGGELAAEQLLEIRRLKLPYFIPRQCIIKPIDSDKSGFIPDVAVLDENALELNRCGRNVPQLPRVKQYAWLLK